MKYQSAHSEEINEQDRFKYVRLYIMFLRNMTQYLGGGLAVFLILFIIAYSFGVQSKMVETMVSGDKSKVSESIKNNTNEVEDVLLISKYRKTYEDTIIELEDNVSIALLSEVVNNAESISQNPSEAQDTIVKINNLKTFKDTLNEAMTILDKK